MRLTDLEVGQIYASLPQPAADIFIFSQPGYMDQARRFARSQFITEAKQAMWLRTLGHPDFQTKARR